MRRDAPRSLHVATVELPASSMRTATARYKSSTSVVFAHPRSLLRIHVAVDDHLLHRQPVFFPRRYPSPPRPTRLHRAPNPAPEDDNTRLSTRRRDGLTGLSSVMCSGFSLEPILLRSKKEQTVKEEPHSLPHGRQFSRWCHWGRNGGWWSSKCMLPSVASFNEDVPR
jgi:hypothetical protein